MAPSYVPSARWYNLCCAALLVVAALALLGFVRVLTLEAGAATHSAGLVGRAPLGSALLESVFAAALALAAVRFREMVGANRRVSEFAVRIQRMTRTAEKRYAGDLAGKLWEDVEEERPAAPAALSATLSGPVSAARRLASGARAPRPAVNKLGTQELARQLESDRAKLAKRG